MKYNFNEKIDRSNNHSAKWEEMGNKFISNDKIKILYNWILNNL